MGTDYEDRTKAVLVAIFFHYLGYLTFLFLDAFHYPKRIRVAYGFRTVLSMYYRLGKVLHRQIPGELNDTTMGHQPANPIGPRTILRV